MRAYNFSAGPSALPLEVLQEAQRDFLDFGGTGMSVTEISHRNKAFEAIVREGEALLRELMSIPDDYVVLFVQGGASTQFAAVPLNLMHTGRADYVVTGNFAKKAWQEGKLYGDAACVASSEDKTYTYIPDVDAIPFRSDADYVHICSNNTIFGAARRRYVLGDLIARGGREKIRRHLCRRTEKPCPRWRDHRHRKA